MTVAVTPPRLLGRTSGVGGAADGEGGSSVGWEVGGLIIAE